MTEAYPLQWPAGWKRTQYPEYSRFQPSTIYSESRKIEHELDLLGAANVIISSDMPRNQDGSISSRKVRLNDTGVAVYFKMNGEERCIPSDNYTLIEDNLHAVFLTVQALRGLKRWGTGQIMEAAFRGFTALPENAGTSNMRAWHEVLQVSPSADPDIIRAAYRRMAAKYHPDNQDTGDSAKFAEITEAYKQSGAAS